MNRLREIEAHGTAVWIDNLSRALLEDGELRRLIDEDGLTGVTSNPTIFQKAMADSQRYDAALRAAIEQTTDPREVYFHVAFADTRDACDLLAGVHADSDGADGFVSFELPPDVADDTDATIAAAKRCHEQIDRRNVLIKVPGTEAGVPAFEELTAAGVNVNVTLLFGVERYERIAEAYLRGLERRVAAGLPVDRAASVASFFVSRVDGKVDAELERLGRSDLRGRAAVANAKLAYDSFQRIFAGDRWEALRAQGACVQRPLWASTSTKNPDYSDTLYVDELIGPNVVNTMPDATIVAARDHATPQRTVDRDVEGARALMSELRGLGIDLDDIVLRQLVVEGVQAFADSFDALIATIGDRVGELAPAGG